MTIDIHTKDLVLSDSLNTYISKKLRKLHQYFDYSDRSDITTIVTLTDYKSRKNNRYECHVLIQCADGRYESTEATMNIYASIDIVEAKLVKLFKQQSNNSSSKYHRHTPRWRNRHSEAN